MIPLRATLRLQCHAGFTFDDAAAWLEYFAALGISHLYLSPVLAPMPGSGHGYDLADPRRINPEAGGEAALRRLAEGARAHGIGLLLDVVANHMAAHPANPFWDDVLRWGPASAYAQLFDIDWAAAGGKMILPVLPAPYGQCLAEGQLRLVQRERRSELESELAGEPERAAESELRIAVNDGLHLPLSAASVGGLLRDTGITGHTSIAEALLRATHPRQAAEALAQAGQWAAQPAGQRALADLCTRFHEDDGQRTERWHSLLSAQHYRLVHWRSGADLLNWRRFFDINELAAVQGNRPEVFALLHDTLWPLVRDGLVHGLRVDHVDGLADPGAYCRLLRQQLDQHWPGPGPWLFVEKILAAEETLPGDWPVHGTTGYEFMEQVSLLLHDARGGPALTALWAALDDGPPLAQAGWQARADILDGSLACDLARTVRQFSALAEQSLATSDLAPAALQRAIRALALALPVYRIYHNGHLIGSADQHWLAQAAQAARAHLPATDHPVLAQLLRWLATDPQHSPDPASHREAVARFGQLSAPLAAKGIEDTLCYRYSRLISRNEVGADLSRLAGDAARFHHHCAQRARHWPATLLATATHDSKRGEDARARLAMLSERAEQWRQLWPRLTQLAAPLMASDDPPHPADLTRLYQTLLGHWPMTLSRRDSPLAEEFHQRLQQWQHKALRETRQRSHWQAPDAAYEQRCADFLAGLFRHAASAPLWQALCEAAHSLMVPGALNSLTQCVLRLTTPGVPDLYQGGDGWDFNLVDPDNRRPVDFGLRAGWLQQPASPQALLAGWRDGRLKQWLIARVLELRRARPTLFSHGDYQPLATQGALPASVLAFARSWQDQALIVIAPYHSAAALAGVDVPHIAPERWGDSALLLPAALAAAPLTDIVSGQTFPTCTALAERDARLPLASLLAYWPVAVLTTSPTLEEPAP